MRPQIIFFKAQRDVSGGYTAEAAGYPIFTQGDNFEELTANIRDAIECHFGNGEVPVKYDVSLEEDVEIPTGKEDRPMSTAKKLEEIDKLEADLTPPESDKERLRLLKGAAGAWKGKRGQSNNVNG